MTDYAAIVADLKTAMAASKLAKDDTAWEAAAKRHGFTKGPNRGVVSLDVTHGLIVGNATITLHYRWYDTSGPFAPGPDRTRVTLEVRREGVLLDQHQIEWDE